MGMQNDRVTISATLSAFLACVVISFVYFFSPFIVFGFASSYFVLVGLVNVIFPFDFVCLLASHASFFFWDRCGNARHGAEFSLTPFFFVLGHVFPALRAGNLYTDAVVANPSDGLFFHGRESFSAYYAFLSYASSIGLHTGRAGNASCVFSWFTKSGNCGCQYSAFATRRKSGAIARIAQPIIHAIHSTLDTSVFCHVSIISHLT